MKGLRRLLGRGGSAQEPPEWVYRASIVWRLPYLLIFLFLACVMVLYGFPIIIGMFALAYVIGGALNLILWVMKHRGSAEGERQFVPWREYFFRFCAYMLLVPALLAPFVGWAFLVLRMWLPSPEPATIEVNGAVLVLLGWALVGVYYGAMGLGREWRWGVPQLRNIRNLPTAGAASAALGLVELRGTARAARRGEPILYFNRSIFVDETFAVFDEKLVPFELEDESGRLRVDPTGVRFTVPFPLLALFTSFLGGRPFFAVLRHRVRRLWWPNREFLLLDGDPVYVLGTLEVERDSDGREYRVVRPAREARHPEPVLESLMRPFRFGVRRAWQDVFIISDTEEAIASRLLARHFAARIFWCLFWIVGSAGLLPIPY